MTQRVIYSNDRNSISILIPAPEFLETYTIEDIAAKDVPAGRPYKIIDLADIPTDWDFRNAWEADFSNPDGHGIGADAWFAEQAAKEQA